MQICLTKSATHGIADSEVGTNSDATPTDRNHRRSPFGTAVQAIELHFLHSHLGHKTFVRRSIRACFLKPLRYAFVAITALLYYIFSRYAFHRMTFA